jgi:hypothetical protein
MARRAFRRPVTPAEVATYDGLAALAQRRGEPLEEALAVSIEALLVSPDFLFRIEQDRPAATGAARGRLQSGLHAAGGAPITDHELAARLSYFLWASMPDAGLRQRADRGQLRRPVVLEREVRRMLQDDKARTVEEFGGQWLQVRALESASPDKERFPAFDDYLRFSMRRETELFFTSIIREDRSIFDFLGAPYTFVNERLTRHYGIEGVTGPEFRRVEVLPSRGGVLTHASVLTVSSYATRTSPVLRGKWLLENLLGAPPPDPPLGSRTWTKRKPGPRRPWVSSSQRTGATRRVPPATGAWIRWASAWRTTTGSARGARPMPASRSTRRASCRTGAHSTARWRSAPSWGESGTRSRAR